MTPEKIAALRDMALTITQPMQEYLLQDICRRVAKAGQLTSTAEYQIYRAQALGTAKKTIAKALADQTDLTNSEIDRIFGLVADAEIAFEDNGSLQQIVAAYAATTKRTAAQSLADMQMVTPANNIKPMMDVYGESMDFAYKQVSTGAADYTTALRQATKNLAARGIREIIQSDGRSVGIEFATRRTLLNQLGLLDEKITQANYDELGCDGWEISAHAGSAPDHEDIQGRQYSDKEYKLLNSRLQRRIGTLSCKHWAAPIILGVNAPQYTGKQLQQFKQDNAEGVTYQGQHYTLYEASQKQSEIESHIRRTKYQCLADESLGDKEKLLTDQIRLVRLREEYVRFSRATGQPTQSERLQVAGFGHSQAGKTNAAYRKLVNESAYRDDTMMKKIRRSIKEKTTGQQLMHYSQLPVTFKNEFEAGLQASVPNVKRILEKYADDVDISFNKDGITKYSYGDQILYLDCKRNGDSFAHELFHAADRNISIPHQFDKVLHKDWDHLLKPYDMDVLKYFSKKRPDVIVYNFIGTPSLKPEYRGIPDIIGGITNGQVILGATHSPDYWKTHKNALAREAWAQFGRLCYNNNEGLKLLQEMFPKFSAEAFNCLEELI